ncbi:MAG: AAA family ATPase [Alphaproteobacteria bacterium]
MKEVDQSRLQWAFEFVDACIAKGLEVIALTDHHEMVMVPYVQKAIAERKTSTPSLDLWLLPGMELTANGGKQCLIIFDADLTEEKRRQAQGKLGIEYSEDDERLSKSGKVSQLSISYADISRELDNLPGLRGHYIVLPNVSQGNNHTVLVDGAHGDFRRMTYVGGYLDQGQTINTLGAKNKKRLSGTDKTWSVREIYPLPTSDSRSSDFTNVGSNNTWIKLSEPTAEAIRQAFLGHQSRISIAQPHLPALLVSEISIQGSAILKDSTLALSPELNSAIGGRGSGKSSMLEYLSFGLGRSCHDVQRDHYSGTDRLSELVAETLIAKNGRIILKVSQDNAVFQIERGPASAYQPKVTYPNGDTQTVTVKELRSLFPAVVYSQGELAEIGKQAGKKTQLADLLQFVNPEYKREDDRLGQDIETAKSAVKVAIGQLTSHWRRQASLRQMKTNRDSLLQRVQALEKTLPEQSAEDQAAISLYEKASNFDSKALQATKHADRVLNDLHSLSTELQIERDLSSDLGTSEASSVRQAYRGFYNAFNSGLTKLRQELDGKRKGLTDAEAAWSEKLKEAREARDAALEKLSEHKTATAQIIKLKEEIAAITNKIGDLESQIAAAGDPTATLQSAVEKLKTANRLRADRTQEWANEIEKLSSGKIKAAVDADGDITELTEALDLLSKKSGSQEATRMKGLEEALASSSAADLIDRVRSECLSLLYWRQIGAATGQEQPKCPELMKILGNTEKIRSAMADLIDPSRVEAISTSVARPEIELSYCDRDREISFEKASEGQRAAALLFMLLEQPGGPLIIDQPEGDLDNKIITDLTKKLHHAKQNRQLVFASHNANIVVNGSSELVAYLDTDNVGDREVSCAGAIDKPEICEVITATMEGGEKAFKDRQEKYGY